MASGQAISNVDVPRACSTGRRHADLAPVEVASVTTAPPTPSYVPPYRVTARVSPPITSCSNRQTTPSASSSLGPLPGTNSWTESARPSTTGTSSTTDSASTDSVRRPGGGQQFGQSVPATATRNVRPGVSRQAVASRSMVTSYHSPVPAGSALADLAVGEVGRPASDVREVEHAPCDQGRRAVGGDVAHLDADVPVRPVGRHPQSDTGVAQPVGRFVDRPVPAERSGVVEPLVERLPPGQPAAARVPGRRPDVADDVEALDARSVARERRPTCARHRPPIDVDPPARMEREVRCTTGSRT
ncbi:MAG: hypothetical protein R2697_03550 [Ilumatobacteraceae bacterium]